MRVLPETQKLGVLTDDAIQRLEMEIGSVDCLAAKGGVVAMRPLGIHASSKSVVEMPRRVLHIEYPSSSIIAENLELAVV